MYGSQWMNVSTHTKQGTHWEMDGAYMYMYTLDIPGVWTMQDFFFLINHDPQCFFCGLFIFRLKIFIQVFFFFPQLKSVLQISACISGNISLACRQIYRRTVVEIKDIYLIYSSCGWADGGLLRVGLGINSGMNQLQMRATWNLKYYLFTSSSSLPDWSCMLATKWGKNNHEHFGLGKLEWEKL